MPPTADDAQQRDCRDPAVLCSKSRHECQACTTACLDTSIDEVDDVTAGVAKLRSWAEAMQEKKSEVLHGMPSAEHQSMKTRGSTAMGRRVGV